MKILSLFVILLFGFLWMTALAMFQVTRSTLTFGNTQVQTSAYHPLKNANGFRSIFSGGRLNVRKFIDFCNNEDLEDEQLFGTRSGPLFDEPEVAHLNKRKRDYSGYDPEVSRQSGWYKAYGRKRGT